MSSHVWGDAATQFFFSLSPEKILEAVESAGFQCTGRILTLNSMENRVYEVEIETEVAKTPSDRFRIVKFYRPGRWSEAQILEEHAFLRELEANEISVIAPILFPDGKTISGMPESGIRFCLFPKRGGRSPDELLDDDLLQVGRLIARIHSVGKEKAARHRLKLNPQTYGLENLKYLCAAGHIPVDIRPRWKSTVEEICEIAEGWFEGVGIQRIHGDCHLGNLLRNTSGYFAIDFDDFVMGPPVQDLWLLVPGTFAENRAQWEILLEGYEQMGVFDRKTTRLIEPLRALRYVHFCAWIAKRWEDPAFPKYFPAFGTPGFWNEKLIDLMEQLERIKGE
ncbi:MAG: serine/threonine protein kinase [Deltaproteobacteria bacterium]|nr:serine/threonine protein kinase [Deltaproteobacteria bacterium]MBI3293964.1 serine/threonine protein kinase [Deltaproteobacteria bacterium]